MTHPDAYEDQLAPIPPARTTGEKVTPLADATRVHLAAARRVVEMITSHPHTEHNVSLFNLLTARLDDIASKLTEMEALP